MKRELAVVLLLLGGCGYSSVDNDGVCQPKKIHHTRRGEENPAPLRPTPIVVTLYLRRYPAMWRSFWCAFWVLMVVPFAALFLCSGCGGGAFGTGPVGDGGEVADAASDAAPDALTDAGGEAAPLDDAALAEDTGSHVIVADSGGHDAAVDSPMEASSPVEAGVVDAAHADAAPPPCGGGPVYVHHAGIAGVTWQDCTPTGTYDVAEAQAACKAYMAWAGCGYGCVAVSCTLGSGIEFENSTSCGPQASQPVVWEYGGGSGLVGHPTCPSVGDPAWD